MWTRSLVFRGPGVTSQQMQGIIESGKRARRKAITYGRYAEPFTPHFAHVNPFVPERLMASVQTCNPVHWEPGVRTRALVTLAERYFHGANREYRLSISLSRDRYSSALTSLPHDGRRHVERAIGIRPLPPESGSSNHVQIRITLTFHQWDEAWPADDIAAQMHREIQHSPTLQAVSARVLSPGEAPAPTIEAGNGSVEMKMGSLRYDDTVVLYSFMLIVPRPEALYIMRDELPYQASSAVTTGISSNVLHRDTPEFAVMVNDLFTDWQVGGVMHVPQDDLDRYIWSDNPAYDGEAWFPLLRWSTPAGKSPIEDKGFQLTIHREGDRRWIQASTPGIDEDLQRAEIQRVTGINEWERIWPPIGEPLRNLKPVIDLSMD